MLVENDFAIGAEDGRPGIDPPPDVLAPVVVVRARRGRALRQLLPPALAILAAGAVLRYRVETPDWQGVLPGGWPPTIAALDAVAKAGPVVPPIDSGPMIPGADDDAPAPPEPPRPVPTTAVVAHPTHAEAPSEVPPEVAAPPAKPADPDVAWDEIRREAERKKAELAEMRRLKAEAPQQVRREEALRTAEKLERVTALADSERPDFRANLKATLQLLGDRAAPRIRSLSSRYSHFVLPETEYRVALALQGLSSLDQEARVRAYRRHGIPEPIILNVLAEDLTKKVVARNGPNDEDDALVRAARQLLSVPLTRADQAERPKARARR